VVGNLGNYPVTGIRSVEDPKRGFRNGIHKEEFKLFNTMLSESIAFYTTQIPENTGSAFHAHVARQGAKFQIADKVRKEYEKLYLPK